MKNVFGSPSTAFPGGKLLFKKLVAATSLTFSPNAFQQNEKKGFNKLTNETILNNFQATIQSQRIKILPD